MKELWNAMKEVFDLNNENEIYWKEHSIRYRSNAEFRLGMKKKQQK